MPYNGKWIPAVAAIAHVMRAEGCDRAAAMRQIEAAVRDCALRWVRRGSNRWDWDAKMYQADLRRLWPSSPERQDTSGEAATRTGSPGLTVLDDLKAAKAWHTRPLPEPAELRRVTELLAELKNSIRQEIQLWEQDKLPADLLEQKISKAAEEIDGEALASLAQGRLAAYLETSQGLERLPDGAYWVYADGGATPHARRALAEGIAANNGRFGLAGTVKFRASDFDVFAEAYRAERGFGSLNQVPAIWPDPRPLTSRAPPPIRPLRGGRAPAVVECEVVMDRSPQWTVWNNIAELRVFEAVALSLNIDPRKVRHNPRAWMAGKRLFNEDQDFNDRFLVTERNLAKIGVINAVAAHYEGQEPIIRLDSFVQWALRIGWSLPGELTKEEASHGPELARAPLEKTEPEPATELAQKPQRIRKSTKSDAVKDLVAKRYPDGIPPGVTRKHIARQVEAELNVSVDERTVGRALGRR